MTRVTAPSLRPPTAESAGPGAALPGAAVTGDRPGAGASGPAAAAASRVAPQSQALVEALDATLADIGPDTAWLSRLLALRERAARLATQHTDATLYHLIHLAGHDARRYSALHGLLCFVVARETALALRWEDGVLNSLELAALTMNAAMRSVQDELARMDAEPSAPTRAAIARHAERGAAMLRAAGVVDPVWIDVVRLHHDSSLRERPIGSLTPAQRSARLLRRVDIFVAKLSCRGKRLPMSPVRAAREACLGAGGMPDEIGAALLGGLGLYPPGSTVELMSGEIGLVVARGVRANLPTVAVMLDAEGRRMRPPVLRAAHHRRHAVKGARPEVPLGDAPAHEWLMTMRTVT